jgi:hypothetical protein
VAHRRPDISAARQRLGWAPQVSLRDGLWRMIDHNLDNSAQREPAAIRAPLRHRVEEMAP